MPQPQPLLADRGFYLGPVFRRAADRHGAVFVTLDRPLDVSPDLGVDLSYTQLADLVEELSARLWAAGVRPSEEVVVHKTDNVDIVLLTCAVSRIGAVPVLLSPASPDRSSASCWPGCTAPGCSPTAPNSPAR